MRLKDYPETTHIRDRRTVTLERSEEAGLPPIELQIEPLPPDYFDHLEAEIPTPEPPQVGIERDRSGKPIFDGQGRAVPKLDHTDPDFRKREREANQLQTIKMILDGLVDGQFQFEASRERLDSVPYYKAVLAELRDFGFHLGDMIHLGRQIQEVSGITGEEVERAMQDFSGAGA